MRSVATRSNAPSTAYRSRTLPRPSKGVSPRLVVSSAAIGIFPRGAEFPIFERRTRFVNFLNVRSEAFASHVFDFRNSASLQLHRPSPDSAPDREQVTL